MRQKVWELFWLVCRVFSVRVVDMRKKRGSPRRAALVELHAG